MGFGHFGQAWVMGLFWAALSLLVAGLLAARGLTGWPPVRALVTLGLAALAALAAAWVAARMPMSEAAWDWMRAREIGIARLDALYYSGKVPELAFQQLMILLLVRELEGCGRRGWGLIAAFALIFGGIHLPIVLLKGLAGLGYVLAASAAALLFVPLIAGRRWGSAEAFAVHLGAYLATGLAMRASLAA